MEAAPVRPVPPDPGPPPDDDPASLLRLVERQRALIDEQRQAIAELAGQRRALELRVADLLRRLYGRRSERLDAAQLLLFGRGAAQAAEAEAAGQGPQGARRVAVRRAGTGRPHGRRPLPDHLPRCRVEHPVDPKDLTCPCGACRRRIGEELSEQLEYSPACLFVIEHVRPKYACPACEQGVVIADKPPQPIEKGLPGPGLIAHVLTSKYADHLPLYRLEGMLARHGVDLDRSTLGGWVAFAADLLMPLVLLMASLVRKSKVINTDDTPVPVLDKAAGGKTRQGRLWVYHGDDLHPYVVFDY